MRLSSLTCAPLLIALIVARPLFRVYLTRHGARELGTYLAHTTPLQVPLSGSYKEARADEQERAGRAGRAA